MVKVTNEAKDLDELSDDNNEGLDLDAIDISIL